MWRRLCDIAWLYGVQSVSLSVAVWGAVCIIKWTSMGGQLCHIAWLYGALLVSYSMVVWGVVCFIKWTCMGGQLCHIAWLRGSSWSAASAIKHGFMGGQWCHIAWLASSVGTRGADGGATGTGDAWGKLYYMSIWNNFPSVHLYPHNGVYITYNVKPSL